jgi:hypothetical protein
MAVSRDVSLNVVAKIEEYQKEVSKIPGVTQKQAARAAIQFGKQWQRGQIEAAKAARQAAKESAEAWEDVGTLITASLSADAIKGAASALFDFAAESMAARQEAINLAEATGLSLETMAGLEVAAGRAGVPLDEILGTFEDFGEVLFDFANGGGRAAEALELLDVEVQNADGTFRETDEVLREVLGKMVEVEDQAKRNAIAQQLFGDAGNRLNAVLGDAPLETYVAHAEQLGLVLDEEAIANTESFTAATAELGQVVKGNVNQFLDLVNLGGLIENFTLGVVFAQGLMAGAIREGTETVKNQWLSIGALLSGDFANAKELAAKGFGLQSFGESLQEIKRSAWESAQALFEGRKAISETGTEATDTSKRIGDLREKQDKAAQSAKDLAREQQRLATAGAKAFATLQQISDRAVADTLTDQEKIIQARDREFDRISALKTELRELAQAGEDTSEARLAAEQAAIDVAERANRDLHELKMRQIAEEQQAKQEADDADRERDAEKREAVIEAHNEWFNLFSQTMGVVQSLADTAFGALAEFSMRQQDAARTALEAARADVQALRDERAALTEELLEAESTIEAARIQARLNELDVELETAKASRKRRRKDALNAWKASRQLSLAEVAFNTAAAAMMAYAMFGPPPSPIGLASAAAAVAAGTTQAALILTEKPPQFHTGTRSADSIGASFTRAGEVLAALEPREAVLNSRAADALGRDNVDALNATGGVGSMQPVFELSFEGRHVDTMVARTMRSGGRTRNAVSGIARTRPVGQIPVFGGR